MPTSRLVRFVLSVAILSPLLASGGTVVAEAADVPRVPRYRAALPVPPPPPPLPFYNWTGLYVGAHVGGGWADLGFGNTGSGFIGGGQIGYNYQINPWWVLGLEAEVSGSGVSNNFATFGLANLRVDWNSVTTLTPRFGYAVNNWLFYGKLGGAWADVTVTATNNFGFPLIGFGGTASAFVAGVGVEYAFLPNWSAKVEWEHFDFGSDAGVFDTGNGVTFETVKFGVNYHFGPGPFFLPF